MIKVLYIDIWGRKQRKLARSWSEAVLIFYPTWRVQHFANQICFHTEATAQKLTKILEEKV